MGYSLWGLQRMDMTEQLTIFMGLQDYKVSMVSHRLGADFRYSLDLLIEILSEFIHSERN